MQITWTPEYRHACEVVMLIKEYYSHDPMAWEHVEARLERYAQKRAKPLVEKLRQDLHLAWIQYRESLRKPWTAEFLADLGLHGDGFEVQATLTVRRPVGESLTLESKVHGDSPEMACQSALLWALGALVIQGAIRVELTTNVPVESHETQAVLTVLQGKIRHVP